MRNLILFFASFVVWGAGCLQAEEQDFIPDEYQLGKGQVLIELFSSEGCSSCPRVEKMFTELANEARAEGHDVHVISWHVDYWDKLQTPHGVWKDPFSSPAYTLHQKNYANIFTRIGITPSPMLVTPQIILNGRPYRHLIKQHAEIGKMMQSVAAQSGGAEIEATLKSGEKHVVVDWELEAAGGQTVTAVLIESGLKSEITAGENHGISLEHDHVVRAMAIDTTGNGNGKFMLNLPKNWQGKDGTVIVFVQDADLQLRALRRLPLSEKEIPLSEKAPSLPDPIAHAVHQAGVCGPAGCTEIAEEKPSRSEDPSAP